MSMFRDHFSGHADAYAAHRPAYPESLYDALAAVSPGTDRVWDCATGNGQAALGLARVFGEVVATDASADQIRNARPHPRIRYTVAPAESSGLPDASAQLVTVGQALHWFDSDRFAAEVDRVLVPGGAIAAWCYQLALVTPEVDRVVRELYELTGPWWPPERALLEQGYRTIPWPWAPVGFPPVEMTARWTLPALLGYLGTWSGVRRYAADRGVDPVAALGPAFAAAWGPPETPREVRWPVAMRVGRR